MNSNISTFLIHRPKTKLQRPIKMKIILLFLVISVICVHVLSLNGKSFEERKAKLVQILSRDVARHSHSSSHHHRRHHSHSHSHSHSRESRERKRYRGRYPYTISRIPYGNNYNGGRFPY